MKNIDSNLIPYLRDDETKDQGDFMSCPSTQGKSTLEVESLTFSWYVYQSLSHYVQLMSNWH